MRKIQMTVGNRTRDVQSILESKDLGVPELSLRYAKEIQEIVNAWTSRTGIVGIRRRNGIVIG